ncbi:hypothetical protein [Jidongwangia harbinensis]|uniref:hypothetical protein n=1 Tax=Jidongwangia harbinensis TaxID=2878561 RepID=UPI001CDA34E2|nr:hypothetical protein [Jidongwangia harbinensis]MCA2219267.1 hypothetical protein [Jidongwangia harbinensis]
MVNDDHIGQRRRAAPEKTVGADRRHWQMRLLPPHTGPRGDAETALSSFVNAMFIKCRRRIDHHAGRVAGQCAGERWAVRCIASAGRISGGRAHDDCFGHSLRYPKSRGRSLRPADAKVKTPLIPPLAACTVGSRRPIRPTARQFGTTLKGPVTGVRHYPAKIVESAARTSADMDCAPRAG